MKTIFTIMALYALTCFSCFGFYNPSTGRWLSRDPIGDEGDLNLYSFAEQNAINSSDPLGLKTLVVAVARDWTLRGPPGGVYDKYVKERNPIMEKGVQEVINKCTACTSVKADVKLVYAQQTILPVPDHVKKKPYRWDVGLDSDKRLMFANYVTLSKGKDAVPMFWTIDDLTDSKSKTPEVAGVAFKGLGITLSYLGSKRFSYLLAHELGHYAGYVGNDNGHSTDPNNVMHGKQNGDTPDQEYCAKVLSLFK